MIKLYQIFLIIHNYIFICQKNKIINNQKAYNCCDSNLKTYECTSSNIGNNNPSKTDNSKTNFLISTNIDYSKIDDIIPSNIDNSKTNNIIQTYIDELKTDNINSSNNITNNNVNSSSSISIGAIIGNYIRWNFCYYYKYHNYLLLFKRKS